MCTKPDTIQVKLLPELVIYSGLSNNKNGPQENWQNTTKFQEASLVNQVFFCGKVKGWDIPSLNTTHAQVDVHNFVRGWSCMLTGITVARTDLAFAI
jgi:hypothetical protein